MPYCFNRPLVHPSCISIKPSQDSNESLECSGLRIGLASKPHNILFIILVAEVGSVDVESGEGAIDGGCGTELHVVAEVVASLLAEGAHSTRHTRLNRNTVT